MKNRFLIISIALILVIGAWFGASSSRVHSWWADVTAPKLPAAENVSQAVSNTTTDEPANTNVVVVNVPVKNTTTSVNLVVEKNLAIPFTSQAPAAIWDADHEEFCEEAAMLMVGRYYQGKNFTNIADMENGLHQIKKWEVDNLGFYFDTTAQENAQVLAGVYRLKVELLRNPTITQIKTAIAAGHPVIVPTAGRELGNPNFKTPGPIYHNLVIRGYTKDGKFITNDPGTRKGVQYVYRQQVVMDAIHNWVPRGDRKIAANGDVVQGERIVLVVLPVDKE